jgi:hypothetical protein
MALAALHSSLDLFAIWSEDRLEHVPQRARLGHPKPLRCFGQLPALPPAPTREGLWSAPAPRPLGRGDRMGVWATPATAPRRGTVLLVPPWKIASPSLVAGYGRLLAAAGHDVWLVCPPHHLHRTAPGARSGEGFVSLDLRRLRGTFEALVLELRILARLAAERGPVGLVGLSLGALVGAFAATAPERLDFAALVAPPRLALVMTETGIGRRYRRLAARAGSPFPPAAALDSALAAFDPSARGLTARRTFIGAGLHDRVAPAAGAVALARAWGVRPALYGRGHMTLLFLCAQLRRDLARFASPQPSPRHVVVRRWKLFGRGSARSPWRGSESPNPY